MKKIVILIAEFIFISLAVNDFAENYVRGNIVIDTPTAYTLERGVYKMSFLGYDNGGVELKLWAALIQVDNHYPGLGHIELAIAGNAAKHEVEQHRHGYWDEKHEDQRNGAAEGTEQVFEGDVDDFHKIFP